MQQKKPKILIITPYSFGYSSLPYSWSQYLTNNFNVTCLCLADILKREKITVDEITVKYVENYSCKLSRYIAFLVEALKTVRNGYDLVVIMYFPGCSIIKLLNPLNKRCILDIQSGPIGSSTMKRTFDHWLLRAEAMFYPYKIVLSESLSKKLGMSATAHIIPIGANTLSAKQKNFNRLDLLYVGTLQNRRIDQTIRGFAQFYARCKDEIDITYTIVGSGFANEEEIIKQLVRETGLGQVVTIAGYVPQNKLSPFFDAANIGVSFIPMTDYYDVQPATKTFEYLLSGMPVLATNTSENRRLIDDTNGVLIDDTPDSFAQGLYALYSKRNLYNAEDIRTAANIHTWEHITSQKLVPLLNSVLQSDSKYRCSDHSHK